MNKALLSLINILVFLLLFDGVGISSEVKREVLRFSSDTAQIKKSDGILHLSGEVKISYGQYVIRSGLLMAKTNSIDSPEVKIIEASKNIYFSNNKDISAKGDKLFMDVDKKFISLCLNILIICKIDVFTSFNHFNFRGVYTIGFCH